MGGRHQHRARMGTGGAPGCPAAGRGDLQELQRGDVGEGCLSDLREGCVHHRPASETKLQGSAGEATAAGGLRHPRAPRHHPCCPRVGAAQPPAAPAQQGGVLGGGQPVGCQQRSCPLGGGTEGTRRWAPGGWHPPHTCPRPAGPPGLSAHACTHACTHTHVHTRMHTRKHASTTRVPVEGSRVPPCPVEGSRVPPCPQGAMHRDPPAVSPWGSGPQGHGSGGARWGRAAALLRLRVRAAPLPPQDTGTAPRVSPARSVPRETPPHAARTPHRRAFAPAAAQSRRLSLPPQGSQQPLPTPHPWGRDLLLVPIPVPLPHPAAWVLTAR